MVEYEATACGEFVPRRPAQCRLQPLDGSRCRLVVDHWRTRPTLELGRLLVLECLTHGGAFTVYPITLTPYQRAPTLAATPDGQEALAPSDGPQQPNLEGTMFEVAEEARDGETWYSREPGNRKNVDAPGAGPLLWRGSRLRQLQRAENWLGVSPQLDDAARVQRAAVLGVEALRLKEGSRVASRGTLSQQGALVCEILEAMQRSAAGAQGCRLERLLWAGHHARLWGRPWFWESATQSFRPAREAAPSGCSGVFRPGGPGERAASGEAPKRPTSWLGDRLEGPV